ncbi:MAG: response regulator [Litorimonas sp.]
MATTRNLIQIAIVEDDPFIAIDLESALEDAGYEVTSISNTISHALDVAKTSKADLFTLDFDLHGKSTTPIAEALKMRDTPFIVISGQVEQVKTLSAFKGIDCFDKPFSEKDIVKAIQKHLAFRTGIEQKTQ